jgi:hypothetical protein
MLGREILTFSGPMIGQSMLFVAVDLLAFLITLLVVMRIGTGKIAQPILVFSLGFLVSAVLPLVWGTDVLWLVPIVQSVFGIFGILLFMKVLGIFQMIIHG